jgi:phage major head subunit gpT-like protein
MVKILPSKLETLEAEVQDKLTAMLQSSTDGIASVIADRVTTSNGAVDLPVILPVSGMEEWNSQKNVRSLYVKELLTKVKNWYMAVGINAYDFEDEQFGLYASAINGMIANAAKEYDKQVCAVLTANPATATGAALFSDTQTWAGEAATQDNLLGLALDETNLGTAVATLESFKDQNGEPLGRTATHLIVPPQLKATALKLTANISSYGGFNVFGGQLQVVSSPYLSGAATTWYVADCSNGRPLVVIDRMAPTATTIDKSAETGKVLVTVDSRFVVAPTVWANIVKSVG